MRGGVEGGAAVMQDGHGGAVDGQEGGFVGSVGCGWEVSAGDGAGAAVNDQTWLSAGEGRVGVEMVHSSTR